MHMLCGLTSIRTRREYAQGCSLYGLRTETASQKRESCPNYRGGSASTERRLWWPLSSFWSIALYPGTPGRGLEGKGIVRLGNITPLR